MGSLESKVSSGRKLGLWSDYADAQTDLNLSCRHMPTCTLCWIPTQFLHQWLKTTSPHSPAIFYLLYFFRIDKLDYQLRSLQAQHQVAETENLKRSNLLEQTTMALSLLENENTKLQKVTRFILASECQIVWIKIKLYILSDLFWVKTIGIGYQWVQQYTGESRFALNTYCITVCFWLYW